MERNKLADSFIAPPYSVIDARKGEWKTRKRMWHKQLGNVASSREGKLYSGLAFRMPDLYMSSKEERKKLGVTFEEYVKYYVPDAVVEKEMSKAAFSGVSTFDPALAELIYHWFTPGQDSCIFDCFAGDHTKGYVAAKSGHRFTGIEIRPEQVTLNNNAVSALRDCVRYIQDDGRNVNHHLGYATQDLLISCPPYYNLEQYSADDASSLPSYAEFIAVLRDAFRSAADCLKSNRFAVVVASDIRDSEGFYLGFPEDLIAMFRDFGFGLWNDLIYLHNDCHGWLRAKQYMNNRKVVRVHQRILVFYKGNPRNIAKYFPKLTKDSVSNDTGSNIEENQRP